MSNPNRKTNVSKLGLAASNDKIPAISGSINFNKAINVSSKVKSTPYSKSQFEVNQTHITKEAIKRRREKEVLQYDRDKIFGTSGVNKRYTLAQLKELYSITTGEPLDEIKVSNVTQMRNLFRNHEEENK